MRLVLIAGLVATLVGACPSLALGQLPHPKAAKKIQVVQRRPMPTRLLPKHDGVWITDSPRGMLYEDLVADSLFGFPPSTVCEVVESMIVKKLQLSGARMKCDNGYRWVFLPLDSARAVAAFNYAFAPASMASSVQADMMERIARYVFVGELASVPAEKRDLLLRLTRAANVSPLLLAKSFQGKTYLRVDMQVYDYSFNDNQVNLSQRVASALTRDLLSYIKAFGKAIDSSTNLQGIAFATAIGHRNFGVLYSVNTYDEVEIFVPAELIRRFAAAEITDQDLVDGSVVLVNDNRTKVVLADAR